MQRGVFSLRLDIVGRSAREVWLLAQACEDLLRERAPAGVEIRWLESRGKRDERLRAEIRKARRAKEEAERTERLLRAAGRFGKEIDVG
jgi:hypothetical protein